MHGDTPRTVSNAAARLRRGDIRSIDLVEASLAAVDRHNVRTNAFIRIHADEARDEARLADAERSRGLDRGPLHGIPMSIKDLIDVKGQITTAGSRVLIDRLATMDATVVSRVRAAGAIVIGRTNLHEFALGTTNEDSAFGPVRNPVDETRVSGGSSGGSAAAVATGMGLASVGSDTGGSIRIPAAACGIVGLKPAYGDVPTDGVIPLSPSFDHVGPLSVSVEDAAMLWAVLADRPVPVIDAMRAGGLRLAGLDGYFQSPVAPVVREAMDHAIDTLRRAGVTWHTRTLPSAHLIGGHYVNIVLPEAAAWHAQYLATRAGDYSPIVRARIESGRATTAVAYLAAQAFRETLRREVDAALDGCDALVLPTLPIVAPPIGSDEITVDPAVGDRTPVRSAMLRQTQPFNLTGHPAISLPIQSRDLPVGLQLVGRPGDTAGLLAIAAACERMLR